MTSHPQTGQVQGVSKDINNLVCDKSSANGEIQGVSKHSNTTLYVRTQYRGFGKISTTSCSTIFILESFVLSVGTYSQGVQPNPVYMKHFIVSPLNVFEVDFHSQIVVSLHYSILFYPKSL